MKVKELITKLQKCDQEMDIVLEPNIDCQDDEILCYLPWDIINDQLPRLGIRYETVNVFKDYNPLTEEENEFAVFDEYVENPTKSKTVVVLSSTQFKYGEGEDEI